MDVLRSEGYQIYEASNGSEAYELAQTLRGIDLLLTDLIMPTVGGHTLAGLLKTQIPGLRVL